MALRIGGAPKPPVEEEQIPVEEAAPAEDLMSELPASLDEDPMAEGGGDVPPEQVFYKSGQQRMSEACENCKHYVPEGRCEIVAGEIDPEGICNIYSPMEGMGEEELIPMGEEAAPAPVEEEVPATEEGY